MKTKRFLIFTMIFTALFVFSLFPSVKISSSYSKTFFSIESAAAGAGDGTTEEGEGTGGTAAGCAGGCSKCSESLSACCEEKTNDAGNTDGGGSAGDSEDEKEAEAKQLAIVSAEGCECKATEPPAEDTTPEASGASTSCSCNDCPPQAAADTPPTDESNSNSGSDSDTDTTPPEPDGVIPETSVEEVVAMTPAQKAEVKDLNIGGDIEEIKDTSSLQTFFAAFENLETLVLSKIEFQTTDAIDLSVLPAKVETVDFSANPTVTNIDLSSSTTIKDFSAEGCTNLETLDVEGNTTIESLKLGNTGLTELNVEGCENLTTLEFPSCGITFEDFKFTELKKLTKLNLSSNRFVRFDWTAETLPALKDFTTGSQRANVDFRPSGNGFNISRIFNAPVATADADSNYSSVSGITGTDAEGKALTGTIASDGTVEFDGKPVTMAYSYDTGHADAEDMKVTLNLSGTEEETTNKGSGGGCDLGFAALGLMTATALLYSKKKD